MAKTFSPINMWDLGIDQGDALHLDIPSSHNVLVLVLSGVVELEGCQAHHAQLVTFQKGGSQIHFNVLEHAKLLVLTGEPLNEPIVGYGPFVMNSQEEIEQAIEDMHSGRFGNI
ncbi:pirin-like C-terminal cupin domain-containing protein [Helicobacter bizzozeronii]|uniref:pirin-like C-terminal cupin domain-containing protein n=1 Tax=Helicobacter bizzozeronii TaxID=56877 RepID=UPI001F1F9BE0|nr:pirin-like C-terminal cupin domain-containing protein [Helicobacter bizzozeronii]